MEAFKLRCRRCRCVVLTNADVVNTHGEPIEESSCYSSSTNSVWYVSTDTDQLPWIKEAISQASWTKGKLSCPKCHGRIGSFDFINTSQCPCHAQTLPGVHVLRDRVDQIKLTPVKSFPIVNKTGVTNPTILQLNSDGRHSIKTNAISADHVKMITDQKAVVFHTSPNSGTSENFNNLSLCDLSDSNDSRIPKLDEQLHPVRSNPQYQHLSTLTSNMQDVPLNENTRLFDFELDVKEESVTVIKRSTESDFAQRDANISRTELRPLDPDASSKTRLKRKQLRRRRRQMSEEDSDSNYRDVQTLQFEMNRFEVLPDEEIPSDDEVLEDILDEHVCPVCLDVYFQPHTCHPCGHMFCESCLRQLAQKSDNSTAFPCPMCRDLILFCRLETELTGMLKIFYPESYKYRLQTDRKYLSHRFPLPQSAHHQKPRTLNQRLLSTISQDNLLQLSRLSVKGITFLGAVIFLMLVMCVTLAL